MLAKDALELPLLWWASAEGNAFGWDAFLWLGSLAASTIVAFVAAALLIVEHRRVGGWLASTAALTAITPQVGSLVASVILVQHGQTDMLGWVEVVDWLTESIPAIPLALAAIIALRQSRRAQGAAASPVRGGG